MTSVLAGFAFGVLRFPGTKLLMALVLAVLMVPTIILIMPDYVIANELHLLNTYWIQIIPLGASVFGIFLVRQFFLTMPQEIMDAAAVDGAGRLRMLWHIGVPAVRPALLLIGLNVFMGSWNSLPVAAGDGIQSELPAHRGRPGLLHQRQRHRLVRDCAAAATSPRIPIMLFFLLLQQQFVRGALNAAGAVK